MLIRPGLDHDLGTLDLAGDEVADLLRDRLRALAEGEARGQLDDLRLGPDALAQQGDLGDGLAHLRAGRGLLCIAPDHDDGSEEERQGEEGRSAAHAPMPSKVRSRRKLQ